MSVIFYARRQSVKRKMASGELPDDGGRDFLSGDAQRLWRDDRIANDCTHNPQIGFGYRFQPSNRHSPSPDEKEGDYAAA